MHEDVVFGTDAAQEIERLVIAPEQDVLAVVNELASVAVDERRRPSAELRPGVQHEDSPASLRQERRRTQTSEACAYDDDVRRHGRRHLPNNDRRPRRRGDERAPGPGHADDGRKDVVVALLYAIEDRAVDGAHDLGRDEPPRVRGRQLACGARVVLPGAGGLLTQERLHLSGLHRASRVVRFLLQVSLGDIVRAQILSRNVDPSPPQILGDVAQDIRKLQGNAQVDGVLPRAGIGIAEDLQADEADGGCDPDAVPGTGPRKSRIGARRDPSPRRR